MQSSTPSEVHIRIGSQEFRARDVAMLKEWCEEGRVGPNALIFLPGASAWVPAAECDPLRAVFRRERPEQAAGEWHVQVGPAQYVAPNFAELKRWHRAGRIPRHAIIYHQMLGSWLNVSKVAGLESPSARVLHRVKATYRGGIKGFPGEQSGIAYLTEDGFEFHGYPIHFDAAFANILSVTSDAFRPSALRILAVSSGSVPQVKNVVCLSYLDDSRVSRTAEIQIHGAISLQGEAENAAELINRINDFKDRFARPDAAAVVETHDPAQRLRELKSLLDAGILTPDEFAMKKEELLRRM